MINPERLTHEELARLAEFQLNTYGRVSHLVAQELIRRVERLARLSDRLSDLLTEQKIPANLATQDEEKTP